MATATPVRPTPITRVAAVSTPARRRELGRGERVVPGVWRLRLPLPWPGVPHCNAWALAAGDGIVLVDTGTHEPGSLAHLERALDQVGLSLDHVRLLVCTHAHADHYGQAGPIVDRAGCELWMHPRHEHAERTLADPEATQARRFEVARQSGVPLEAIERFRAARGEPRPYVARWVEPDRDLVPGVTVWTDLGEWQVIETPGHAPSHVCLHQPEHGLLISGDHLLGRVSLYYDVGWTPDPAGEFLASLDAVEAVDARLCLAGHARPFRDVGAHIEANRTLVGERMAALETALADDGPRSAYDLVPAVHGAELPPMALGWWLPETLAYLVALERTGRARRVDGEPERWALPA